MPQDIVGRNRNRFFRVIDYMNQTNRFCRMSTRTKKRIVAAAVTAATAVSVAVVSGSLYLLHYALTPQRKTEKQYLNHLTAHSPKDVKPWLDSISASHAIHDIYTRMGGRRMHAIYITAPSPTPHTAVVVHGYKDCSISMLHIAYIYNKLLGFNVLLPDLYGHGKSDGDHINMGWLDRLDVLAWMDIANRLFGGNTQMVVHGISMGAATTMCVSGEKLPSYVKCFVEDCGYTSVWDEFGHELREQFNMPKFPLLNTASTLCRMRYGWSFGEASPIKQVAKCRLPMLFIHGDSDDFVPSDMLRPLYEAKKGTKDIYVAKGTKHARAFRDHPEEYIKRVTQFVRRYIK